MLEVIHHGQVLTQAQLDVLTPILGMTLSGRNTRKAYDIALAKAGLPVEPLKKGDLVGWSVRDIVDEGEIIDIDIRADKYRVKAKSLGRAVTIPGRVVRLKERASDDV